jgi:hypothetical protein
MEGIDSKTDVGWDALVVIRWDTGKTIYLG